MDRMSTKITKFLLKRSTLVPFIPYLTPENRPFGKCLILMNEVMSLVKDCLSYGFTKMHPSVVRCWLCNLSLWMNMFKSTNLDCVYLLVMLRLVATDGSCAWFQPWKLQLLEPEGKHPHRSCCCTSVMVPEKSFGSETVDVEYPLSWKGDSVDAQFG